MPPGARDIPGERPRSLATLSLANASGCDGGTLRVLTFLFILLCFLPTASAQQTAWEDSPYRVNAWVAISPELGMSSEDERELFRLIRQRCEADFGGVWSLRIQPAPESLYGSILYRIDELEIPQLLARELTLVVGKSDAAKAKFLEQAPPQAQAPLSEEEIQRRKNLRPDQRKELEDAEARAASLNSVRTLDSAIERVESFHVLSLPYAGLQREIEPYSDDPRWKKFAEKLKLFPGSLNDLKGAMERGDLVAALVPKTDLPKISDEARPIPARLPWQPEALLRDYDKIYLITIDRQDALYRIRVKELDSMVRHMGDLSVEAVVRTRDIPSMVAYQMRAAFTPMVRIEETDNFSATLRLRAGSLIVGEGHPAYIGIGDVVRPFIRRDDANGNPTLLQPMPFTYIAATERIDKESLFYGAIFAASRGALTAAKNRRTQRLGLKVRPRYSSTDLRLSFRPPVGSPIGTPSSPAPGAEVYLRTPGHEDLVDMGRTDWRGIVTLKNDEQPVIQYEIPTESRNTGIANARSIVQNAVPPPEYKKPVPPQPAEGEKEGESAPIEEQPPKGEVKINVPLYLYYIRNGDTLLARLPVVTGYEPMDNAVLPDDRRRLETEAFLKGLQNEVLDLVVRRKILETRINTRIAENKIQEAESILEELKRVKTYDQLSVQIEQIQLRALDPERGLVVGPNLTKRINTMVDTTRKLMQSWLQDNMLRDLETKISEAK